MKQFDFIVLGNGIAGLSFAPKVAPRGRVAITGSYRRPEFLHVLGLFRADGVWRPSFLIFSFPAEWTGPQGGKLSVAVRPRHDARGGTAGDHHGGPARQVMDEQRPAGRRGEAAVEG